MSVGLCWVYNMWQIVFFTFLAVCSAELGYQYQPSSPHFGYETDAGLDNSQSSLETGDHYQAHADYHKHFYAFEAPYDNAEEAELVEHKISDLSQKNLQVVFIKAPENKAVEGAFNALAKQTSEDKTAIYVLNKQTDSNELASKLSALQAQHKHKPQVHFVKYRTDAEAAHAQQHIQAQYGGAGGRPLQPSQQQSLGYSQQAELSALGYSQQAELPLPPASLGLSQQVEQPALAELPLGYSQASLGYSSQAELQQQQSYYANKEPQALQGYYPQPAPPRSYLPPLPNYAGSSLGDVGNADLPPLPVAQQQLAPSLYDLDARTAKSQRIDFRVNERHRSEGRMVFPTGTPSNRYLPTISNSYLPPQRRRRRARF